MTGSFDDRIVKVTIQIEDKTFVYDQNYYITAQGQKFAAPNLGIGEVRIDNISKSTRNYFISKTSLYNTNATLPVPAILSLDVGRKSYGTFRLFTGQVIASPVSQPPDISLTFRSMTGAGLLGFPLSIMMPPTSKLSAIAAQVAQNLGVTLAFQATDKAINNYSYTGSATFQIQHLQEAGNVDAYVDNTILVVKDSGTPRKGSVPEVNDATGLIGIPQLNERGIALKQLINNEIRLGGSMNVTSALNPAANGVWRNIYRLGFNIASRDTPFYWLIEANNSPYGYAA